MIVVNKSQTTLVEGEARLVTEASTIDLAPGEWPDWISVVNDAGSGYLFGFAQFVVKDGDLSHVEYIDRNGGFYLTVLND